MSYDENFEIKERISIHPSNIMVFSLVFSSEQSTFTLRVNWTTTVLNA